MAPKVLVVLTSQDKIPGSNEPTGWYLSEFAHPWHVLKDKAELVIASPKGGEAPLDPGSMEAVKNDAISSAFAKEQKGLWSNTKKLADLNPNDYDAIFYVGGHGPMFDLATDKTSLEFIRAFVSAKKPVSAVCHGPAALVNAIDATGQPLLKGATVTGFSNVEEGQLGKAALMPFELETELNKASGGRYVKAEQPWGEKVVVSKAAVTGALVITGQNPASATGVGREILKALV